MGTYNLNAAHAVGDAGFTNAFNAAAAAINDLDSRVTSANTAIGNSLQTNEIAVAPNTELSLTGAGTVASPLTIGSASIIGAGRPDVAASMSTAVQTQVAAAPVGSTFASTDGASVGAWAWQKIDTGWVITSGDTKNCTVTSGILNSWAASSLNIRRVGNRVIFTIGNLDPAAATSDKFYELPVGFSPLTQYVIWPIMRVGSSFGASATAALVWTTKILRISGRTTIGSSKISPDMALPIEWTTEEAWPLAKPTS